MIDGLQWHKRNVPHKKKSEAAFRHHASSSWYGMDQEERKSRCVMHTRVAILAGLERYRVAWMCEPRRASKSPDPTEIDRRSISCKQSACELCAMQARLSSQTFNPGFQARLSSQTFKPDFQARLSSQAFKPGFQARLSLTWSTIIHLSLCESIQHLWQMHGLDVELLLLPHQDDWHRLERNQERVHSRANA